MLHDDAQDPALRLRELREQVGLSQRELARRAGVAANTVRNAELGVVPRLEARIAIARALRDALVARSLFDAVQLAHAELDVPLELWPVELVAVA